MQAPDDPLSAAPPPGRWLLFGMGLVGVAMFLGFGALAVAQVGAWRKLSRPPSELAVADALRPGPAEKEAWVRLRDLRVPCAVAAQRPNETSSHYRLASDAEGMRWLVLESHAPLPCDDSPHPQTGTLRVAGGVVDLAFPEQPWSSWPEPRVVFLAVDADPTEGPTGAALVGVMALLGVLIARFYFAGFRRGGAASGGNAEAQIGAPTLGLPAGPVLPARALRYHPQTAGKPVYVVGFLLVCAAMFGVLASSTFPARSAASLGVTVFAWGIFLFFVALAAFLVWLSYRFVRVTQRQRRLLDPDRIERWVPLHAVEVALAKGVDVGNRSFQYDHPNNGATASLILGADEAPPWIVEAHVLVVHPPGDPDAHHVVRVNGAPFALTRDELAALGG